MGDQSDNILPSLQQNSMLSQQSMEPAPLDNATGEPAADLAAADNVAAVTTPAASSAQAGAPGDASPAEPDTADVDTMMALFEESESHIKKLTAGVNRIVDPDRQTISERLASITEQQVVISNAITHIYDLIVAVNNVHSNS